MALAEATAISMDEGWLVGTDRGGKGDCATAGAHAAKPKEIHKKPRRERGLGRPPHSNGVARRRFRCELLDPRTDSHRLRS